MKQSIKALPKNKRVTQYSYRKRAVYTKDEIGSNGRSKKGGYRKGQTKPPISKVNGKPVYAMVNRPKEPAKIYDENGQITTLGALKTILSYYDCRVSPKIAQTLSSFLGKILHQFCITAITIAKNRKNSSVSVNPLFHLDLEHGLSELLRKCLPFAGLIVAQPAFTKAVYLYKQELMKKKNRTPHKAKKQVNTNASLDIKENEAIVKMAEAQRKNSQKDQRRYQVTRNKVSPRTFIIAVSNTCLKAMCESDYAGTISVKFKEILSAVIYDIAQLIISSTLIHLDDNGPKSIRPDILIRSAKTMAKRFQCGESRIISHMEEVLEKTIEEAENKKNKSK